MLKVVYVRQKEGAFLSLDGSSLYSTNHMQLPGFVIFASLYAHGDNDNTKTLVT